LSGSGVARAAAEAQQPHTVRVGELACDAGELGRDRGDLAPHPDGVLAGIPLHALAARAARFIDAWHSSYLMESHPEGVTGTPTGPGPSSVAAELKRHVEAFPPVKVELPWGKPDAEGRRKKFALLFTTRFGNAIAVNTWNTYTWKPALAKAGVIPPRAEGAKDWQWEAAPKDGFHVLRHTYASIMLAAGESVVTVARWLGHSSPTITLGYHPRLLCSLHAGGRKQGADGH
jgi:hypothetical protein